MRVRFEEFVFDSDQWQLSRSGVPVHVSPKALVVLDALIRERPRVMTKAALQSLVWPDVVVEESNLTNLVSELRCALNDDPRRPRYIRTSHGFGYSFVGKTANDSEAPVSLSVEPGPRSRRGILLGAVPLMAVIAVGLLLRAHARVAAVPYSASPIQVQRLPLEWLGAPALSPDRRFVAYSTRGRHLNNIRLYQLKTGVELNLTPPEAVPYIGHTVFSPDGNWVYYMRGWSSGAHDELLRVPVPGGPPELLVRLQGALGPSFALSPDGQALVFIRSEGRTDTIVRANADGSNRRDLVQFQRPESLCCSMSWSQDGTRILATIGADGKGAEPKFNLAFIDPVTGAVERKLDYSRYHIWCADWVRGRSGFVAGYAPGGGNGNEQVAYFSYPSLAMSPIDMSGAHYIWVESVDSNTVMAISFAAHTSVWTIDLDHGGAVDQLTPGEATDDGSQDLVWCGDDRIVYSAFDRSLNSVSLRVYDLKTETTRQLTSARPNVHDTDAAVSPDGRTVLYAESVTKISGEEVSSQLFRISSDGGSPEAVTPADGSFCNPYYTDGGRSILFTKASQAGTRQVVMRMAASGGVATPIESTPTCATAWGPDPKGRWIACCDGHAVEFVMPISGGKPRWMHDLPASMLAWTADGELSYVGGPERATNVVIQPLDGRPARQATRFETGIIDYFAWSPHGHKLAIARRPTVNEAYIISNLRFDDRPNAAR